MRKKILLLIFCILFCCSACGTSTEQEDVRQSEKAGSTLEMYEKDGKMVIRNSKYHYQISLPNEYHYIISTMPENVPGGEASPTFCQVIYIDEYMEETNAEDLISVDSQIVVTGMISIARGDVWVDRPGESFEEEDTYTRTELEKEDGTKWFFW